MTAMERRSLVFCSAIAALVLVTGCTTALSPDPVTPQAASNIGAPHQLQSPQPQAPPMVPLSTSEIRDIELVKQQIEACWTAPAEIRNAQNLRPEFRVWMNLDGTVRSVQLLDSPERLKEPLFRVAVDHAKHALLDPRCQPFKLPTEIYSLWQTFTITFDPKDIT